MKSTFSLPLSDFLGVAIHMNTSLSVSMELVLLESKKTSLGDVVLNLVHLGGG